MDNNKTSSFFRLVDSMKRAKNNQRPFTIFIGAGCSLSSSSNPINTEALLLRCLQDHYQENYVKPNTWEQLYKDFINLIWEPNGFEERREILSEYFRGLRPESGYQNLRLLIENKYITQIITTNFDLLINEALYGLAYQLKVGDSQKRSIQGGSNIFVYKVHGDIESGDLRFSPDELANLPENTTNLINEMTDCTCMFCGYSGQDIGVMNAISKTSGHSIFWVSPDKPNEENGFDTRKIYQLLEKRNSSKNFIFGSELGLFDNLMSFLVKEILNTEPIHLLPNIWKKSIISKNLSVNSKVLCMFENILLKSEELVDTYNKKIKSPFFTIRYKSVLNAFLFYFDSRKNIPEVLQIPENEIEALLIALSIEILSRTANCDAEPIDYAKKLREIYERNKPECYPDHAFWSALYIVLDCYQSIAIPEDNIEQICLIMNNNGRLTFNIKKPRLNKIANILSIINVCALLLPTSDENIDCDIRYKSKKILESKSQQNKIENGKFFFVLNSVSMDEFKSIYNSFFKGQKAEFDRNGKIIYKAVIIEAKPLEISSDNTVPSNISEYIMNMSKKMTDQFLSLKSAFELEQGIYVSTPLEYELSNFASSKQLGMFIIGASGSGKTKALQHYILSKDDNYIIAATSPKCGKMDGYQGINIFFNEMQKQPKCEVEYFIKDVDLLLKSKGHMLLLMIDGINEIAGGFEKCVKQYKKLIDNLNDFTEWGITNIKIIVTCRDFAFIDYCNYTNLYPTAQNCYYQTIGNNIRPHYQILPLTLDLQIKFCEAYITDSNSKMLFIQDIQNNKYLQQAFTSPYLIAIVGNHYKQNMQTGMNLHIHDIFSEFTMQMLRRLNNFESQSIAYQIINAFFEFLLSNNESNRRLTPFVLLQQIPDNPNNIYILNQLKDLNIFVSADNSFYLRFSHDRIEEFFLTEFLFENNTNIEIIKNVLAKALHESVYQSGLHNYVKCNMEKNAYEQVIHDFTIWYNEDTDLLPLLMLSGLESLNKEQLVQFMYVAKQKSYTLEKLLSTIQIGLKKVINNSNVQFPIKLIESLDFLSNIFMEFNLYKPYIYYWTSRYYQSIENNINLTLEYCKKASISNNSNDIIFENLIKMQNTIIQKQEGELIQTLNEFSNLYEFFYANSEWDHAAECILEWGSILRKQTRFEEALEVYQKIDLENIKIQYDLVAQLHRKKGTIYKNLLQNLLRDIDKDSVGENDKKQIRLFYDQAMNEYTLAVSALKYMNNTPEMIAIRSEQTEATLKIAKIIPEMRAVADIYSNEEAKLLSYSPIPDRMVVYLRELSKKDEFDENYDSAIERLQGAKQYAQQYGLSFRIFEINYQLGRLVDRAWCHLTIEQRKIGINALDDALCYPLENDNQYRNICMHTRERINQKMSGD